MPFHAFARYLRATGAEPDADGGPWPEEQKGDYESGLVRLDGRIWRVRTARITPTKPGAFVAVWERGEGGATRPFAAGAGVHGLLVLIEDGNRFGAFHDLDRLGVTRSATRPGKRGFRLYPAWCSGLNAAAQRTQRAQASCFAEFAEQTRA